ncbi:MAG TPA: YfhO family protein [Bacteroidales bacterium]|nr:YfhO family protein [Bacteroidales bacterium]
MQLKNSLKPALPHIIAVAIFLVVTAAYFYPVLEGKVLHTNDGTVAYNSAKEISDFRTKYGEEPLWTNSMFSGMPAYLISIRYSGNVMQYAHKLLTILRLPIASIFLSMLGFYILLLIFKVDWRLAIAGALAYGFSTYFFFILAAGHNTKAIAIAYMAPMIGGICYTYRRNAIRGALITTFFLTLEIIANHPQITYYAFMCILVFIIGEFVFSYRRHELPLFLKNSAILIVPVLLSVGMNFNSLYTTYEYSKYSTRSRSDLVAENKVQTSGLDKDYITQWSYGVDETLTLLIPDFRGGACQPFDKDSETVKALRKNNSGQYVNSFMRYWGSQPWVDGPVYVGAIIFFLFILGLIIVKGPEKWWLLAATVLSIMLAWGKNFMPLTNIFLNYFPGYNKFRAVTMILVIAEFCIPLLGVLALRDIFNGAVSKKDTLKGLKIAFGITGGLTLLFVLLPGLAGSFTSPAEQQMPGWLTSALISDRKELLRSDSFRSFILILLGALLILAFYHEKVKKEHVITIFAILFLIDMWSVDKRYLNADKFVNKEAKVKMSSPTIADNIILKDVSDYRVLNLTVSPFNDASTSLYHKSIGGYHGAKLKRYQELIDSSLIGDIAMIQKAGTYAKSIEDFQSVFNSTPALNMLNTKYVIINPQAPPVINPDALGNAWFVETPVMVNNANEELATLNKIDPSLQAVIDRRFKDQIKNSEYPLVEGDKIELKSYKANELVYNSSANNEKLAVFSEIYYPAGWKCYVDGKESNYFRANYTLRAMIVPAGNHEIKFSFKPSSYTVGNNISMASSVIFILLLAGWLFAERKMKLKME